MPRMIIYERWNGKEKVGEDFMASKAHFFAI
jgi:hypothetical protein